MAKYFINHTDEMMSLPDASDGKESAYNAGDPGSILGLGKSSGEGRATHSSSLPWLSLQLSFPGG